MARCDSGPERSRSTSTSRALSAPGELVGRDGAATTCACSRAVKHPEVDAGRFQPPGFRQERLDPFKIVVGKAGRQQLHQGMEALDVIALECERSFVGRQGAVQVASPGLGSCPAG